MNDSRVGCGLTILWLYHGIMGCHKALLQHPKGSRRMPGEILRVLVESHRVPWVPIGTHA